MPVLEPPHTHHLSAAQGWLELGNLPEARAELARIPARFHQYPDVLEVAWSIAAHAHDWPTALELARALMRIVPESPSAWLHQAYALRRTPDGGLPAAWKALHPALEQFPNVPLIPYNLACYACQLKSLEQARQLFQRALQTGDPKHIKQIALKDPDLQPLWPEISSF